MYKCNFDIDYYDFTLEKLFGCKLKVLSIHSKYLNLIFPKYDRMMTMTLSREPSLDFSPDRVIIDQNKYYGLTFNSILSGEEKILWIDKYKLNFYKDGEKVVNFNFCNAEKYKVKTYSHIIVDKINFTKLYDSLLCIKNFLTADTISDKVILVVNKILTAIKKNDFRTVYTFISKNIGLGIGSTPEFDDFICGMLVVLELYRHYRVSNDGIARLLKIVKQSCKENLHKTTFLSRVFISHILSGRLSEKLARLIMAGLRSEHNEIIKFAKLIFSDGATSGYAFLYGMLKTVEVLNEKYN